MFFDKFDGWKDLGRGQGRGKGKKKRVVLVAHFTDADGTERKYCISALNRLLDNPPESFDIGDHALVLGALKKHRRQPR
tara:strand:- start:433 stop:669 length:237 start_codon:yes stop_codon:yes gene_type:complete